MRYRELLHCLLYITFACGSLANHAETPHHRKTPLPRGRRLGIQGGRKTGICRQKPGSSSGAPGGPARCRRCLAHPGPAHRTLRWENWGCIVGKWAARAVDGCHRGKTRFSGMAHKSAGDPEPRARYRSILSRLLSSNRGVDTQARSLFARRDPGPRATQTAFDGRHIGIKTSRFLIRLRIRFETLCVSCDHCNFRTASCPTL